MAGTSSVPWKDGGQISIEHHNVMAKTQEGIKNKWFLQKAKTSSLEKSFRENALLSKAPLMKIEYVTNTQCERRERLAFNIQPTLQPGVAGM